MVLSCSFGGLDIACGFNGNSEQQTVGGISEFVNNTMKMTFECAVKLQHSAFKIHKHNVLRIMCPTYQCLCEVLLG